MEPNTEAIIRLAWARALGLADDALGGSPAGRITRVDDRLVTFVALWRHRVLIAPGWLLERAAEVKDRDLLAASTLLSLSADHAGRLISEVVLSVTDRYVERDDLDCVAVTDDAQASADLERQCPPDDVAEVRLSAMAQRFVTLDDRDQVTCGAGYDEWEGILAHVRVLTPPELRRSGWATVAAALATNDALDSGLVAQWRATRGNRGSSALARRLGYRDIGAQTTVLLSS